MDRAIYTHHQHTEQFEFIDNQFHSALSKETSKQVVLALEDGRVGIATGTAQSDPETLTAEARRLCPFSRKVEYSLPSEGSSNHEPQNLDVPGITTEQIVDFSQAVIEAVLKAHPEMTVDVHAYKTRSEASYENSLGVRHHGLEHALVYVVNVQRSSEEDLFSDYRAFDHQVHGDGFDALERHVAELARRLPIVEPPAGEPPALLLAQCLPSFLTAFWQALDGKRLFEKQSPFSEKFGQRLFDERFSLTIDPLTQGTGNFDFEGVAGREVKLVEAGVLRDGLYDLEYAKKCGTRASGLATGNLRDRFQTEPIRIPRGSETLDALIQDAGRGILIQHCSEMSRTTNLRGDFSCGLDALLFEDGQIRGRIKNLNMSGNVFTLLRDGLTALSGEGESSPTLGVIAPHLLIQGIRFTA